MSSIIFWRVGIVVSCGATVAGIFLFRYWQKNLTNIINKRNDKSNADYNKSIEDLLNNDTDNVKNNNLISELPEPKWIKVGNVKELYYYPLKSGRGKETTQCEFTEYGISIINDNYLTLRDRMFLVYNEDNGKFITGRNYPTLILVSLYAVDKLNVRLEAVGMSSLIFQLPENSETTSGSVNCKMWWGESIKCIDCGNAPAEWISKFLTGTDCGLRIGLATLQRRNFFEGPWEKFTKVYNTLRNEDSGLFSDLTSYMLMTESSLNELNKKLTSPVSSLQFRPNIIVSGTEPFTEDNWEWIKIGDNVIIRNVKPCPRCKMTQVDPETGTMDKYEPLKTLKTFREQLDPVKIAVDGKAPLLGIYCGLYSSGNVKIGDEVFVHVSKNVCTTNV